MANQLIEFDYYVSPDNIEYLLADYQARAILSTDGMGMSPYEFVTQQGVFQHGESILAYRLKPRVVQMILRRQGDSRQRFWDIRSDLINNLRINRQTSLNTIATGKLRKILPDGTKRDLNVLLESGLNFPQSGDIWDEWSVQDQVRFIAHDPVFYGVTTSSIVFALASLLNLHFPITFPILFGGSLINDSQNVTYSGTWFTFPTITLVGPMTNPTIYNDTTGEFIAMSYVISVGRTVTIDLSYGQKTVEDDLGTNLIGTISSDSNLATFHLAADPEATNGVNSLRINASGATAATSVSLSWYERFIGI